MYFISMNKTSFGRGGSRRGRDLGVRTLPPPPLLGEGGPPKLQKEGWKLCGNTQMRHILVLNSNPVSVPQQYCSIFSNIHQNNNKMGSGSPPIPSNFRRNSPNFRLFGLAQLRPSYGVYSRRPEGVHRELVSPALNNRWVHYWNQFW